MTDIETFIRARLDEDEQTARAVAERYIDIRDGSPYWPLPSVVARYRSYAPDPGIAAGLDLIKTYNPARVLREVQAKRAIVDLHKINSEPETYGVTRGGPPWAPTGKTVYWCGICDDDRDYGHISGPKPGCQTLRLLASAWSGDADYDPAWTPEAT